MESENIDTVPMLVGDAEPRQPWPDGREGFKGGSLRSLFSIKGTEIPFWKTLYSPICSQNTAEHRLKVRVKKRRYSRIKQESRRNWVRARGHHAFATSIARNDVPQWLRKPSQPWRSVERWRVSYFVGDVVCELL